ncbi:MAG TPA: nicotinate-nucleotide adenylyltransferase [Anaerolineaceae bacterium]|nr:nicotinate-nucleotide adenylyltransferase [Anaerolineaceae bacterium]HQH85311.1 nicotinate-nucleotide adenylyltransferase [Anaerolineaceae bacterium]
MTTRLGIFGGTFDPPHVGHLILAEECLAALQLDRLLWVLTPNPPHKTGQIISPLEARLAMLQAAIGADPRFELSRVDIDRPAPHYALDTVRLLREQNPGAAIFYLMGGDSLHDLPAWHRPAEFLAACDGLGVMRRLGDAVDLGAMENTLPGLGAKVQFVEAPLIEISARDIRQRAAANRPYRYYLTNSVYQWIKEHELYR